MKLARKKSTWMTGFVLSPRKFEIELMRTDSAMRVNDYKHKQQKRGRS